MALLKGFSEVDVEGNVKIPSNIGDQLGFTPGCPVEIKIIRIKDSSRWPYLIIHHPYSNPRLTRFQVIMMEGKSQIDSEGKLALLDEILEEAKLKPDYRVEIKLMGSKQDPWAAIHNRGPNMLTTLQLKFGIKKKKDKKWPTQKWEY